MRPTKAEVTSQLQEWRVSKRGALDAIGRHLAEAVLLETIEGMVAEVRSACIL